jgi:hypothetical protein
MIGQNERGNKSGTPTYFFSFPMLLSYLPPFWPPIETRPRSGNHKKLLAFNGYLTGLSERLGVIHKRAYYMLECQCFYLLRIQLDKSSRSERTEEIPVLSTKTKTRDKDRGKTQCEVGGMPKAVIGR